MSSRKAGTSEICGATVLCVSNNSVCSYLVELRNIAIHLRSLNHATATKLKKAPVLIGTRRVRKQISEKATDLVDGDEEDWDQVYDLLAANQVAIADDTIALQQFGEVVFCAPQEDILESKCPSTLHWYCK